VEAVHGQAVDGLCGNEGRIMIDELLDLLAECAEFLDRYADYESDGYGGMEPNSAARLMYDVQQMINKAEGSL
jgi:hypothetical protein